VGGPVQRGGGRKAKAAKSSVTSGPRVDAVARPTRRPRRGPDAELFLVGVAVGGEPSRRGGAIILLCKKKKKKKGARASQRGCRRRTSLGIPYGAACTARPSRSTTTSGPAGSVASLARPRGGHVRVRCPGLLAAAANTARGLWFSAAWTDRCAGLWLVLFNEATGLPHSTVNSSRPKMTPYLVH